MTRRLPPGVTEDQFQRAMRRMAEVVGPDWVLTSDEDIHTYRDAFTPFRGDEEAEYVPGGAVAPKEVEQVQKVVVIANENRIPLWPISTGRNLGYGGAAPRLNGTVMVDLKRMDRVLEVDERRAWALVEPGVSYFDMYKYLRDRKLKLWIDCADPGWGSLIGNAMDHGVGHTPYRDHFAAMCGLEVVLPNGELLRTGTGALPGTRNWQNFHYGFGPHVGPMFGQGNFGIVTKAGFWLLPEPEAARSDVILLPKFDDIHPFLDVMASLTADRTLDCNWHLETPLFDSDDPQVKAAVKRSGGEPSRELDKLGREKNLSYWSTRVYFFGGPKVIDAKWEYVQSRMKAAVPGVRFTTGNYHRFPQDYDRIKPDADGDTSARESMGIPSLGVFTFVAAMRAAGHLILSPVIGMSGEELLRIIQVLKKTSKALGMKLPYSASAWHRTCLVVLIGIEVFSDAEKNRKVRENVRQVVKTLAAEGWGEYRAAPAFMDDVMNTYSYNNHSLRRFNEAIKDALDPQGIIAPGRSGIWPKSLRGRKFP